MKFSRTAKSKVWGPGLMSVHFVTPVTQELRFGRNGAKGRKNVTNATPLSANSINARTVRSHVAGCEWIVRTAANLIPSLPRIGWMTATHSASSASIANQSSSASAFVEHFHAPFPIDLRSLGDHESFSQRDVL